MDRNRKVIIPFQFEHANPFDGGMAKVVLNKRVCFINKLGTRITPMFDGAFDFHEGLAAVIVGDKVGYIRRDGSSLYRPLTTARAALTLPRGWLPFG